MCDWQLGSWVEFSAIVGKQATATGSLPAVVDLDRTRRGIVVGKRTVYEVQGQFPPRLVNPQPVLLIAVSLGRLVRVFPADAQASQAPTPRRTRRSRTAATPDGVTAAKMVGPPSHQIVQDIVSAALATKNDQGRAHLSQDQLELLVASEINQLMTAGVWYTAYGVTLALRAAFPDIDFNHGEVRPIVHAQMEALIAAGLFDRENAAFGSASAIRYVPA